MRTTLFLIIFMFCSNIIFSQELVLKANFAVRDFKLVENSIIYIEKRAIKSYNLKTKSSDTLFKNNSFFIGGYGLNLFYLKNQKIIITASNELVRDISSIRFYDIMKKEVNKYHVLYNTNLMGLSIQPKDSLFFLSKKDSTIQVYNYGNKPRYKKIDSIKINSLSRRMKFYNNKLYFITDSGYVNEYNLTTKIKRLLYKSPNLLVNFVFDKKHENLFISSFEGNIIKVNLSNLSKENELIFGNQIIEAIDIYEDKFIIAGDWKGCIKIIDLKTFDVIREYDNKHRIIKIVIEKNFFYTSDSDKAIKKWEINISE